MRKRLSVIVLILLASRLCHPLMAQASSEVIFNARWLDKEYQRYELRCSSYALQREDTTEQETFVCQMDVIVKDSTYNAFFLEYALSDFKWMGPHYLNTRWVHSLKDFRIVVKASPVGVLQEIQDSKTFSEALDKSIDDLFKHYGSLPELEAREKLYALRADVQAWILSAIVQFHSAYGLAYREGEVLEVPDKMAWDEHSEPMNVLHYKKLEDNSDGVATLVTATVPVDTLYAADSTILPFEQTSAMMMHIPTGWPVYTYRQLEFGTQAWKEGLTIEISLKK